MKLTVILLTALGTALASSHVVHERRDVIPSAWSLTRRAPPSRIIPLRIGLKQANLDRLYDELMSVSHPESANFGKHWSPQQVADFFRPSQETKDTVRAWLSEAGFDPSSHRIANGGHWVEVDSTVEQAEELLQTEYHVYKHESGKEHLACTSYSLPEHIQHHVDLVTPSVHFDALIPRPVNQAPPFMKREQHVKPVPGAAKNLGQPSSHNGPKLSPDRSKVNPNGIINQLENCDQMITPNCLRALYEVVYKPVATHKNSYGIVEYTPQAFLASDLDKFFGNFSKSLVGSRPELVSIDGGVVQTTNQSFDFNGESDLDLEYSMTLSAPQKITLYQTGDIPEGASFNNLLDALDGSFCTFEGGDDPNDDGIYPDPLPGGFNQPESCGIAKPANVISTSFGMDEADVTPFYAQRQCAEYGKLGLMGTTILYSSGDFGVAGNGGLCLNPDGSQSLNATRFNPTFPSGCPFVTSVGATQINPGSSVLDPESACEQVIFSGGGFSNFFEIPDYQIDAVNGFLDNHPPPFTSAQFNNSRHARAFPDLSANGANYVIAIDGEFALVFGTSASSPVVGSILTLINDARLAIGKSPIGFINPTIYSSKFRTLFNDITTGGNQGCNTTGFESAPGWDPVTGLGTINFPKLLAAWLELK